MFESFIQGARGLFDPTVMAFLFAGVVVGVIVGVIPILGGMMVMALFLPFLLGLPQAVVLGFLLALISTCDQGGSITSILLGIPGTPINAATILDGHQLAIKGEASRAIGASITGSVGGALFGVVLALGMVLLIVPVVLAFRVGDIAILVLLGLTLLAVLAKGSPVKGLIAGLMGLLVSTIGIYEATGTDRFAFGNVFLFDGLDVIIIAVGLFGVSALYEAAFRGHKSIVAGQLQSSLKDTVRGALDVWHHRWLWFRSVILGYIVGVVPGAGGNIATWTAYAQAKQTCRDPETFGTGRIEGVIAPESSNNAKEGGALLTTLVFGVPGSASMAIMIAALYAVGVTPGPVMVQQQLPLAFTLILGLALANVIGSVICFFLGPQLAKVAAIPLSYLFPAIAIIIYIGTYSAVLNIQAIVATFIFGVLGVVMARLDYSRPSFLLGFVLGSLFEHNLLLALKIQGPFFWTTPISLILILMILFFFLQPVFKKLLGRGKTKGVAAA